MAAKKKKSVRSRAKTKVACERAGGKPVHFKGMKKGEVICFPKSSKKKSTKRKAAKRSTTARKPKRKQTAKQRAASLRNLKKARAARG